MDDGRLIAGFEPLPAPDLLATRWQALEADGDGSFFLGWCWTGSWLRATGAQTELLSVRDAAGVDAGLALIGRGMERRLLARTPTLRLNEAGVPSADRAFIEYNAPLARRGCGDAVVRAMAGALGARRDWSALRLSGVAPDNPLITAMPARRRLLTDRMPAYFVDLAAVRARGGDYLALLSANTRSQIRRSARDYPTGPEQVERACDPDVAALWLAEMQALNAGRHADNAWDEPVFRAFAGELVRTGMADGSVDLLRISAGGALLGLLLNFCWRGRAMNYQSAFATPVTAKSKPGLMAHAAAVRHYASVGYDHYSLLAGRDRYKQSLATGEEALEWWLLERFSPMLEAENWLRRIMRRPIFQPAPLHPAE